jgi:hypothetical protein
MSKSNSLKNAILDHILAGPDYTRPATVHVSLHSADPTDAGSGAELSGGSYARVAVTNNATNWPAAASGAKANGVAVAFPTATADWTAATHFAIWDASSAGNMLYHGALTASKTVQNGDTLTIPIGDIDITED